MNTVRTVAATKAAFQAAYQRPINSVYRRFVEEYMTELHLVTVSSNFAYDPFFALGMVKVFDTFIQGYTPDSEIPRIFDAICQSLQLKPDVIRQDANKLTEILRNSDSDAVLSVLQRDVGAIEIEGIGSILDTIRDNPDFRYSRTFLLGIYSALELVAGEELDRDRLTQQVETIAERLNLSLERVKKDMELYQSNIEKLTQAQALLKDMAEAAQKKKEEAAAAEATASDSPEATSEETVESGSTAID